METTYRLNTVHFREEVVCCLDKKTIRSICDALGIPVKTAADRKHMAKKLSDRIETATLNIQWRTDA